MSIELSGQQLQAVDAVIKWSKTASKTFILTGHAGSGKTTIAKTIASNFKSVLYGAFTGKAASVLESKGCIPATTIHSMIYKPVEDPISGITEFKLNVDGPVSGADLVVIDEVSMVRSDMMWAIDQSLRLNRGRPREPFGGVRLVLFGDLFEASADDFEAMMQMRQE